MKARAFESFGVKAIVGSLDDLVTLEGIAAESDVVIECVRTLKISGPLVILTEVLTSPGRCGSPSIDQGISSGSEKKVRDDRKSPYSRPHGMLLDIDTEPVTKLFMT